MSFIPLSKSGKQTDINSVTSSFAFKSVSISTILLLQEAITSHVVTVRTVVPI
jgi:hypothetical protein